MRKEVLALGPGPVERHSNAPAGGRACVVEAVEESGATLARRPYSSVKTAGWVEFLDELLKEFCRTDQQYFASFSLVITFLRNSGKNQ